MAKKKSSSKRGLKAAAAPEMAAPAPAPSQGGGRTFRRLVIGGIALAIVAAYVIVTPDKNRDPNAPVPAGAAPSLPDYGTRLDLETVSKFEFKGEALDITADSDGQVYVLTQGSITRFTDGKETKSVSLGNPSAMRCLAFDGSNFYVSNYVDKSVVKVDKALEKVVGLPIKDGFRTLGISVSPLDRLIYVAEVDRPLVHLLDSNGVKKGEMKFLPQAGHTIWAFDMKHDRSGNTYVSGQLPGQIAKYGADRKLQSPPMQAPWPRLTWERMPIVNDRMYINCFDEERLKVMDLQGRPVGFMKKDTPQMIGSGRDGFIYLKTGNAIQKIKALPAGAAQAAPAAEAAPVAPVAEGASPTAKK